MPARRHPEALRTKPEEHGAPGDTRCFPCSANLPTASAKTEKGSEQQGFRAAEAEPKDREAALKRQIQ